MSGRDRPFGRDPGDEAPAGAAARTLPVDADGRTIFPPLTGRGERVDTHQLALAILRKPAAFWTECAPEMEAERLRLVEAAARGYPEGHVLIEAHKLLARLPVGHPRRAGAAELCGLAARLLAREAKLEGADG